MSATPRFIVKTELCAPGMWYVWDVARDELESTFTTCSQACYWADHLNANPYHSFIRPTD